MRAIYELGHVSYEEGRTHGLIIKTLLGRDGAAKLLDDLLGREENEDPYGLNEMYVEYDCLASIGDRCQNMAACCVDKNGDIQLLFPSREYMIGFLERVVRENSAEEGDPRLADITDDFVAEFARQIGLKPAGPKKEWSR